MMSVSFGASFVCESRSNATKLVNEPNESYFGKLTE